MLEVSYDPKREAVNSILNQLRLALQLLEVSVSEGDTAWRAGVVDAARDAYVYVLSSLGRMPSLALGHKKAVHARMGECREALSRAESALGHARVLDGRRTSPTYVLE